MRAERHPNFQGTLCWRPITGITAATMPMRNPSNMKIVVSLLLIIIASLAAAPAAIAQAIASAPPIREEERAVLFPTADMLETGRNVARAACSECHGMEGMMTGKGQPYLAGQRAVYLYRVLDDYRERSRDNESMQHAIGFLNDEALLAVSAYYANLTPQRRPRPDDEPGTAEFLGQDPFAGIEEDLGKCTRCHGETGNSATSGMPNVTAQHPDYFVSAMQAYADGSRSHRLMGRLVGALEEPTIELMGLYYAVQEPLPTDNLGEGDAEAGRVGAESCANCHGAEGNASGSEMPTLAGQDARYFIKAMEAYRDGERKHQPMQEAVEGLAEEEISDLAAFYASQTPVRRDVRAPFSSAEWVERCERCHGIEGNSTDPRFPMLAGQNADYLRRSMQAYAAGERSQSIMHAMSEPLTQTDVNQIVNYYASQEPKAVVYLQAPCPEEQAE
jgi:cytochrome c553